MKIKETIGIDVSKLTLDACIHGTQQMATFVNSAKGFALLVKWAYDNSGEPRENHLFAFEHTGLYSEKLREYLTEKKIPHTIIPGLEIKRSLGIVRGKDDRIDAAKIARYAYRLRDEITLSKAPSKQVATLKKTDVPQRKAYQTKGRLQGQSQGTEKSACSKGLQIIVQDSTKNGG